MLQLRQFLKKNVNAPEDMDKEASDHPELNKYQDAVATDYPKVPEDLEYYSSFIP